MFGIFEILGFDLRNAFVTLMLFRRFLAFEFKSDTSEKSVNINLVSGILVSQMRS